MATIYDMLELDGLPGVGDVIGQPGTGADVEFLMNETTADVPDDYFSTALGQVIEAGFHIGSLGTWPAEIDGTTYATNDLYETTFDLGGTTYSGFLVQAIPTGGGATRWFLIPEDEVSPLNITSVTIQSMTSVTFVDADDAATDDTISFVVCFAAGTRIATPNGAQAVESLRWGDLVSTLDHGDLPVLWVAETHILASEAAADEHLRAIELDPGAFAEAMPTRPLRVSRQHRLCCAAGSQSACLPKRRCSWRPRTWLGCRVFVSSGQRMRFISTTSCCHVILSFWPKVSGRSHSGWARKRAGCSAPRRSCVRARSSMPHKYRPDRLWTGSGLES